MFRGGALLCALIGGASAANAPPPPPAAQPMYLVKSDVCSFDVTGGAQQACSLGDTMLAGNTLRAGLVGSGSVAGLTDTSISPDYRATMAIAAGSHQGTFLLSVTCASTADCTPLVLSVNSSFLLHASKANPPPTLTLGWAVLTPYAPAVAKPPSRWKEPSYEASSAVSAALVLVSGAFLVWRYNNSQSDDDQGGGKESNNGRAYTTLRL